MARKDVDLFLHYSPRTLAPVQGLIEADDTFAPAHGAHREKMHNKGQYSRKAMRLAKEQGKTR